MMNKLRSISITMWIFIGMILGIVAGFIVGKPASNIAFVGTMWIKMMKISLAPIVLVMIAKSIGEQKNAKKIGFVAVAIMFYYVCTTFIASILGIIVANITRAGTSFAGLENAEEAALEAGEMSIESFALNLMPDNLLKPLAETTMLQVLVIGVIIGAAVLVMPDKQIKDSVLKGLNCLQELLNGMLRISMRFAPVGIFCSMASLIGEHGSKILGSIAGFLGTMVFGIILQIILVYCLGILLIARKNPLTFLKRMLSSMMIALTTSSSLLVVPSNLEVCHKYNVDEEISNFTIPLGAVFNLDGAAVFFPVCNSFCRTGVRYAVWIWNFTVYGNHGNGHRIQRRRDCRRFPYKVHGIVRNVFSPKCCYYFDYKRVLCFRCIDYCV
ncbi:MAG: dicarboxylate/amino acid:cation symporter [Clostridia bacterium]|nr:dicarboxylate/amino acid:cation symporter [Clostridia bacterium]